MSAPLEQCVNSLYVDDAQERWLCCLVTTLEDNYNGNKCDAIMCATR
jgi:hypothetical protein